MQNILKEWIKLYIIKESEVYAQDPADFDNSIIGRLSREQSVDFTNLSVKDAIKTICMLVEEHKELNISFIDQYDARVPRLSVNPEITWDTPHGIYGYPLNSFNLKDFIHTGSPTKARFATDRNYFHIYKISDLNAINIKKDYQTSYDEKNYYKDIKTLTILACRFILSKIERSGMYRILCQRQVPNGVSSLEEFRKEFNDNSSVNKSIAFKRIVAYLFLQYESQNKNIPDFVINDISRLLTKLSYSNENKFKDRIAKSKFYSIYYISHFLSNLIQDSSTQSDRGDPPKVGGIFTMLLNGIGIDSIQDIQGTSLLHQNEPNQTVSFDINRKAGERESYQLLGTFKNFYKKGNHFSTAEDAIQELLSSGQLDIDTIYPEKTYSLEEFESEVKESMQDYEMYYDYIISNLEKSIENVINLILSSFNSKLKLEDNDIDEFKNKLDKVNNDFILKEINNLSSRLYRIGLSYNLNVKGKAYKNITDAYFEKYKKNILEKFANVLFYNLNYIDKYFKYDPVSAKENNYLKLIDSLRQTYSMYEKYRTE